MSTGSAGRDARSHPRRPDARAAAPRRGRWLAGAARSSASRSPPGCGAASCCSEPAPPVVVALPPPNAGARRRCSQQLEQARLGCGVAEARSQELERQIDALNQKLTESQDELTFFRKAREGSANTEGAAMFGSAKKQPFIKMAQLSTLDRRGRRDHRRPRLRRRHAHRRPRQGRRHRPHTGRQGAGLAAGPVRQRPHRGQRSAAATP